ncbi:MAG TPA: nitroreductase family protein [Deltaproteobacteria bacterium]|nr:nitroreductase family protein [Deltaproteobacteria bacterium]
MIKELVMKNRSYRRFFQDHEIEIETLKGLVDLARLSASAANLQPLKYILSCDARKNSKIFAHLGWAGYLKDWPGPDEGERPSAYIIIVLDTSISKQAGCDHGIAAQSILIGAAEKGLGGCMIASIERKQLSEALDIPKRYEILLVVALGRPKEKVRIVELSDEADIQYWRDENGVHHVPKRSLEELIIA